MSTQQSSQAGRSGIASGRFYFGWRIVFAMFLAAMAVYGHSIYAFIILAGPMAKEFGWTAVQSGTLVSAMWLMAPLALFVAPVIQRFGPLYILCAGLLIQAGCFLALPLLSDFFPVFALRLVMGAGKIISVIALPVMISRWFSLRFSTAMALAWSGGSFGGFIMAPLTERLVTASDWRGASMAISVLIVATVAAIALLCRGARTPADLDLAPDGVPIEKAGKGEGGSRTEPEVPARFSDLLSVRLSTAVLMMFAIAGTGAGALSMLSQAPTLIEASGISATVAATTLGLMGGASWAGQVIIGWMVDRLGVFWANLACAISFAVSVAAFTLLGDFPEPMVAGIAGVCFGLGMGANEVIWIILTKRQFGTRLFPFTYAVWSCALQAGYALGGPLGGAAMDNLSRWLLPIAIAALYVPATILAVWRPGLRNDP